ncbi:MAG: hypothetical protein U0Y10_01410 [Spirosomataceae bacterium]
MTLRDIFQSIAENPTWIVVYFLLLPVAAYLIGEVATGSRDVKFWGYVYAVLSYLVCIPGIFAVTLNVYLFLFERQSVWDMNLVTQALPILSMIITLMLIKRKIPFELIPGFGKLSGFLTLIAATMGIMWFIDRTHIYAVTFIPFQYIAIGFLLLLLIIRFAWSKIF